MHLLRGAGVEATRANLRAEGSGEAAAALRLIEEAGALGDLDEFDAAQWAEEAFICFLPEAP